MKITVESKTYHFNEGDIVCLKDELDRPFLVTVPAKGYDCEQGTFWAINLTGNRCSGGNYQKDLFVPFHGTITIEV